VVAVLTADQIRTFAAMGWIVVPGLVAPDVLSGVDNEVDRLITEAPPPDAHVGHHFYWQTSDESPALFSPLPGGRSILAAADELVGKGGVDVAFDQCQVALNIAFWPHRPGRPHIDGYAPGHNTGGNERDCTRRAVYWRLRAPEHVARWEDCLVDPWFEYSGVRRLLEDRSIPGQRS
jgi:hypothetical protein